MQLRNRDIYKHVDNLNVEQEESVDDDVENPIYTSPEDQHQHVSPTSPLSSLPTRMESSSNSKASDSADQYRWHRKDPAIVPSDFLGAPFSEERDLSKQI